MANINVFALGGQDENGKNLHVIEIENDIYIVNIGLKVPVHNRHGVDGIISDTTYLEKHRNRIKGVFITHAHDECFAALPWFLMDFQNINIYASSFTNKILKNRISKYKINHKNFQFADLKPNQKIGSINVKTFELANSIPGSLAINFQTVDGDILYMSRFTNDDLGFFGKTDLNHIKKESNDFLAVLMDSRRANYHNHSNDKKSVIPLIEKKFQTAKPEQRIIVGGYDEEMYTLQEVVNLTVKYKRKLIIYGSAFDFLYSILPKDKLLHPQLIDFKESNKTNNVVILVTGTWSRLYQRFYRIATNNDVYLKLKNSDIVIQIAPPVNGLEVEGNEALDEVAKKTFNITDVSKDDYYPLRPTHDDIIDALKILKPKYFFPISALYRYLVVASKAAISIGITQDRNIILKNGKVAYLKDGQLASQNGTIKQFGDVLIDGFGVGDIIYEVIKERRVLGSGGFVSIASQIDRKTKKLIGDINVQLVGIATKDELKFISEKVKSAFIQKVEEAPTWNFRDIQNSIRKRVRKVVSKINNKEPLVIVSFQEV